MGNFGKRILIVVLCVLFIVAIAIAGNAYQQASKDHNVKNSSEVVYSGTYNGQSYTITKGDIWYSILYSSPMGTADEMIDKYLLSSVIENVTDQSLLQDKLNELVYSTTDADDIATIQKDDEKNDEYWKSFAQKVYILGLVDESFDKDSRDITQYSDKLMEYIKLNVAYDQYARFRIDKGLTVGSTDFSTVLTDEKVLAAYEKEYADTYAIAIKFYSQKDATTYLTAFNDKYGYTLCVYNSKIRMYAGGSLFRLDKNSDSNYYCDENLKLVLLTQKITRESGSEETVNVPNGNILTENSTYIWATAADIATGGTYEGYTLCQVDANGVATYSTGGAITEGWVLKSKATEYETNAVALEDQDSFSASNTALLSGDQFLTLYQQMYSDYYDQQRNAVAGNVTMADFIAAFGYTTDASGLLSATDLASLSEVLKNYGYVAIEYTEGSTTVQEIRKYVGNDDYLVSLDENGVAESSVGFPTYKEDSTNETKIPNYKIQVDENGDPILDSEDRFIYYLDANGDRIPNDTKLEIKDQTSFTLANTITATNQQLYSIYIQLYGDYNGASNDTTLSNAYTTLIGSFIDDITYIYDDLSAVRSDVAKQIFTTLTYDTTETGAYIVNFTSYSGVNDSEDPYYLIYKLSSSEVSSDPSAEVLAAYKETMIQTYLDSKNFNAMCMAELRAEAGLQIYDQFFVYEYQTYIAYDEDDNPYGISDSANYTNYYKEKSYKKLKVCELKMKDKVEVSDGVYVSEPYAISTDDLYDYAMSYTASSYISSTTLDKVVLMMKSFTEIHGTETNYLKSKNWKMKEYASTCQSYNYYYEYYKSLYQQYGYTYYDTLSEFLYNYGTRSFDDMVSSLERSTMRNFFVYDYLFDNTNDTDNYDLNNLTYTDYGKSLFESTGFNNLYNNYYDMNVYHVLIYVDYNEDGSADDFNDFYKLLEDGTITIKDETGAQLTKAKFESYINELETMLLSEVYQDSSFSSSDVTALSTFVTNYNESSRVDGKYAKFKKLGISLMYESLGDVTNSSATSYVNEFESALTTLAEKLYRVDKELLGYSISDGLTKTIYGYHFIVGTAGTNYEKLSFEFLDEGNDYAEGVNNSNDTVALSQIAAYIQNYYYSNVYGSTDNPEDNAGFAYPNIPTDVSSAIELYFSSYLDLVLDKSYTYHANYIMLKLLLGDTSSSTLSSYQTKFTKLTELYEDVLFGDFK